MNTAIYDHTILDRVRIPDSSTTSERALPSEGSDSTKSLAFDEPSIASAYENGLVPSMFRPWALRLVSERQDWDSLDVLDLAAGTGVVTELLATAVGRDGSVVAADINTKMLDIARSRLRTTESDVTFSACSATALTLEKCSVDRVVCQQGFQFFPDKSKAAAEIYRVLRPAGDVYISTWLPVESIKYFRCVDTALRAIGRQDLASRMRTPFDYMPAELLRSSLVSAGFTDVRVEVQTLPFVLSGGLRSAVEFAFSLPIESDLRRMSVRSRLAFEYALGRELRKIQSGSNEFGRFFTHVLRAQKPVVRC